MIAINHFCLVFTRFILWVSYKILSLVTSSVLFREYAQNAQISAATFRAKSSYIDEFQQTMSFSPVSSRVLPAARVRYNTIRNRANILYLSKKVGAWFFEQNYWKLCPTMLLYKKSASKKICKQQILRKVLQLLGITNRTCIAHSEWIHFCSSLLLDSSSILFSKFFVLVTIDFRSHCPF